MLTLLSRLLLREPPVVEAAGQDAADFARIHAGSFRRGWSESEFERLLTERNIVAHKAAFGGRQASAFVLSRIAGEEAEILSIAVDAAKRNRGIGKRLLDHHLRRLAGLGVAVIFLEVESDNLAACRLYARYGFAEVGRRPGYYGTASKAPGDALILQRRLA